MKHRVAITLLAVSSGSIGVLVWQTSPPALATDAVVAATVAGTLPALAGDQPQYSYVGNKKCKKCHIKQYKSWEKTRMAKAFSILVPGEHKEAKEKYNVDVNKDFTQDTECLPCHTVGFQKPGGYAIPDPNNKKALRTAKKLRGVGCECCHGPGSAYVKVMEEIQKSKRKYDVEEQYAAGLVKISKDTCIACHNERSPTVNPGDPFDFEQRKDKGTHEHLPLKQRK